MKNYLCFLLLFAIINCFAQSRLSKMSPEKQEMWENKIKLQFGGVDLSDAQVEELLELYFSKESIHLVPADFQLYNLKPKEKELFYTVLNADQIEKMEAYNIALKQARKDQNAFMKANWEAINEYKNVIRQLYVEEIGPVIRQQREKFENLLSNGEKQELTNITISKVNNRNAMHDLKQTANSRAEERAIQKTPEFEALKIEAYRLKKKQKESAEKYRSKIKIVLDEIKSQRDAWLQNGNKAYDAVFKDAPLNKVNKQICREKLKKASYKDDFNDLIFHSYFILKDTAKVSMYLEEQILPSLKLHDLPHTGEKRICYGVSENFKNGILEYTILTKGRVIIEVRKSAGGSKKLKDEVMESGVYQIVLDHNEIDFRNTVSYNFGGQAGINAYVRFVDSTTLAQEQMNPELSLAKKEHKMFKKDNYETIKAHKQLIDNIRIGERIPILRRQRYKLEKLLTAADKKEILQIRMDKKKNLDARKEMRFSSKLANKENLTKEEEVRFKHEYELLAEEKKSIQARKIAMAKKYANEMTTLMDEIKPQREGWNSRIINGWEEIYKDSKLRKLQGDKFWSLNHIYLPPKVDSYSEGMHRAFIMMDPEKDFQHLDPAPPPATENVIILKPYNIAPDQMQQRLQYTTQQLGRIIIEIVDEKDVVRNIVHEDWKTPGTYEVMVDLTYLKNVDFHYRISGLPRNAMKLKLLPLEN